MEPEKSPPWALVHWAHAYRTCLGLKHPWDRPWHFSEKDPRKSKDGFSVTCRCMNSCPVGQYSTTQGGLIYLGQCQYCESVCWS